VWRCKFPDCTFFVYKAQEKDAVLGRNSFCCGCSDTFIMNEQSLTEEWPICVRCRFKSQGIDIDAVTKEIERLTTNENITAYTKIDLSKPPASPESKSKNKVVDEVIIDSPSEDESNSISPVESTLGQSNPQSIKDRILIDPFGASPGHQED